MPEVRGKVSGVVELTCSVRQSDSADVSSESLHVVEWVRQGLDIPVLIKFGSYPPRVHPQYEGRVSLVGITTLKLEGLQLDDQGPYECRILSLDKPTAESRNGTWIMLSVTASPTFTKTPPPVLECIVGGHLSLVCAAIGNPLPTITWMKDGNVIQMGNDQEEVLSLTAVSFQSAGQYTCHAYNSEGNATLETKVKIKGPPVIIVPPKSTSVNISQNALLDCHAVADPTNMTYMWLKGGENVFHLESLKSRVKIMVDGTLLISNLIPEDSGNYTCVPSNGLLIPPTASANLTVMHPAKALPMPVETYLASGIHGMLNCSSLAHPPLLRVDWTKDGKPLDLTLYPGWTLTPEGNLMMATINDDVQGVFSCTPFNSYGSMGQSGQTKVILQDPPSFSITPEKQYRQKVGRTLLIQCQGNDDSTVKVNWTKVDLARRIPYSIMPNGSLLLRPLTKDHHGTWECTVFNRVAHVKAFTQIFVLGTSPHVATSLSVFPGMKQANISWEAGFDGGSAQTFSVWVKKISRRDNEGKQEWFSVPVPAISGTTLLVTGLSPATKYQFSLLSHNKIGSGPFSEIITAWTLGPTPSSNQLKPPSSLSAILGSAGVVLHWSLAQTQPQSVTGFVLQSRVKEGDWINLDDDISANISKIVVPGLHKDCVYELRLLARRGELLSEPSPSVNVSTMGMQIYPSSSRLLEVPESLLPSILGGVGFMCLTLVLLLGSACLISHKRNLRSQKKQNGPGCQDTEKEVPKPIKQNVGIEMSVDDPVFEVSVTHPTKRPMLHHRIESHVREGCPHKGRYKEMRRSTSFHYQENSSRPELRRVLSHGSKLSDSKQQKQDQNISRQKDTIFLTPDAWIDSLSQEKHSDSSTFHPESLLTDNHSSAIRNLSKYSENVCSDSQITYDIPPARHLTRSNPLRPVKYRTDASVFPYATKWPGDYQGTIRNEIGSLGTTSESSRDLDPHDGNQHNNQDPQEAEVYEGVPDSGSSYSSFASSGRGSMESANRRLSLCHLSANITSAPETEQEDGQASAVEMYHHQIENIQRKPSVDENYEWDEADITSQPGDDHGWCGRPRSAPAAHQQSPLLLRSGLGSKQVPDDSACYKRTSTQQSP
nr:protein turtle homolog A-like [Nerophis lumbriciformis]